MTKYPPLQKSQGKQSALIKFNQGQALKHLADMYPTLLEVILELVQNSLDRDVRASRVWITINYKTRHMGVRDNGAVTSIERFNDALSSVAQPGRKGQGSLGQFGIGLISPLGKCERFIFISCPAPHKYGFQEWTFISDDIVSQKDTVSVPYRSRPDLTLEEDPPTGKTHIKWRSEMSLIGFTTDNVISRVPIDSLVGAICDRYAETMRRNRTQISVDITDVDGKTERRPNVVAPEFRGKPLPEVILTNRDAGKTTFRLFASPRKARGRCGRVLVGVDGNDFRFPFHYVIRAATELLGEAVVTALSSGIFEGEIVCEKVTLMPTRRAFEKDDAFLGMCCAIEEWYKGWGEAYVEEFRQSREDERLQELGLRSLRVLENLLKDPANESLLNVINSFRRGTIGIGHADLHKKVVGTQEEPALSVDGKPGVPHKDNPDALPRDREDPNREKKYHNPFTVSGPRGKARKIVRGSSFGLQLAHEAMEGSPDLWKFDTDEGILIFNIRHPLWIACDVRDQTLMKLQEFVAMEALTLQMMPENQRPFQRQVLDEFNHSLVSWILSSDKARGTLPGRKPKNLAV